MFFSKHDNTLTKSDTVLDVKNDHAHSPNPDDLQLQQILPVAHIPCLIPRAFVLKLFNKEQGRY